MKKELQDNLSKGFGVDINNFSYTPPNKKVLDSISLKVEKGEFISIIGCNAAGKSTILKALSGELVKEYCSGSISIAGQKIYDPINQIIDRVGIVHQYDDYDLIPHLSVAQNIAIRQLFGRGHNGKFFSVGKSWKRKIATALGEISEFKHPPNLNDIVGYLSGGQKQMLNVSIAIHFEHQLNPCRLLLLDEHTSRLDPNNSRLVMDFTAKEVRKNKITSIMVTHKFSDAINYTDRIIIIKEGRIVKDMVNRGLQSNDLVELIEKEIVK